MFDYAENFNFFSMLKAHDMYAAPALKNCNSPVNQLLYTPILFVQNSLRLK